MISIQAMYDDVCRIDGGRVFYIKIEGRTVARVFPPEFEVGLFSSGGELNPAGSEGWFEEKGFLLFDSGAPLAKRADVVEDPDTTTVGACDEIAIARVYKQVIDGY